MRNFAMNIIDRLGFGRGPAIVALAGALVFSLFSCEQPFRVGLGQIVDAERPGISLVSPDGGSPIRGSTQTFTGQSWDDLRVEAAQFRITAYPGLIGGGSLESTDWQDIRMGPGQRAAGRIVHGWEHTIDIGMFRDGELRIRIRVSDGVERDGSLWVESEDIAFFIRNSPPAINMSLPLVDEGSLPGQLGGPHLNFNFMHYGVASLSSRSVDSDAGVFAGTISDDRGVNRVGDPAAGRRPPAFRLWEISDDNCLGVPIADYVRIFHYRDITAACIDDLPWLEFGHGGSELIDISPTSVLFFYRFNPEVAEGRNFAFQIRAQNVPLEGYFDEFHFPADAALPGDLAPGQRLENSFVAFLVVPRQTPPDLELLRFQDVFGENGWNGALGYYNDIPGLSDDVPHPLITDLAFNAKSGAFTLRVRTSHESGVSHAMAFWEGGGERGRLIWDPVEPLAWIDAAYDVPASLPFSRWGRGDPNLELHYPNVTSHRNFVFTYGGGVPHRVPNSAAYHEGVRGRYRIQRFLGSQQQWDSLYMGISSPAGWSAFYGDLPPPNNLWEDHSWEGVEGVFSIRVYARTPAGTANTVPLVTSLTLDRAPPVVELSLLDGAAGETTVAGQRGHIVNSVIRPRLFTHDARAFDSGPRVSGGYFARGDGRDAEEVMFVLVRGEHREAMERLPAGFWPLPPAASAGQQPVFPSAYAITVSRHGPIHDSVAYIQTSCFGCPAGGRDPLCDPLPQDGVYWLYVFARDRAFNVGRAAFPLDLREASALPVFDFSIGLVNRNPVTVPDQAADVPGHPGYGAGFRYRGAVRNMLRPTTDIRFRVRDYDGLDLGVAGGAESSMRISFEGSFVDAAGTVRPLSDRDPGYEITLSDAQVKAIFAPGLSAGAAPREREGTIPQSLLLDLLRASPLYRTLFGLVEGGNDGFNSLPDGLYRVIVGVSDYYPARVHYPGQTVFAPLRSYAEFWIAVDNVPPAVSPGLDYVFPPNEQRVTLESFHIGSQRENPDLPLSRWLGTVWDDNGPIEVYDFRVLVTNAIPMYLEGAQRSLRAGNFPAVGPAPGGGWVTMGRIPENQDTWEYSFQAHVELSRIFPGIEAGDFEFTLTLRDRFGNPLYIERRHQQDEVPPTVMLTRPVETFARLSVAGTYICERNPGGIQVSVENARRLANGVISFTAHASDNFTVDSLHWWLLPAGRGVSGTGAIDEATGQTIPGGLTNVEGVEDFNSFPVWGAQHVDSGRARGIYDPSGNAVGAFGRLAAPGGTVYIDTLGMDLPDGEYVLHIIARDAHLNQSHRNGSTEWGRVFLLQAEDAPYFHAGIAPAPGDVRGDHNLRVTGIIMDDDGFGTGTPAAGSVRMWVSRAGPPTMLNTGYLNEWGVPRDLSALNGLTLSGRDIILNVGLREVFTDEPILYVNGVRTDGRVDYVIRAMDAVESRAQGPYLHQERASRYQAFYFTLDSMPPEITLFHPDPGGYTYLRIFREGFPLVGEISDVHLPTMPSGGVPYVLWRLNGNSPQARFPLPIGSPPAYVPVTGAPVLNHLVGTRGEHQTAWFNVNMSDLLSGSHFPGGVPANNWLNRYAAMFADPGMDGEYTLELTVVDGLGLADVVTLNFTIDRGPPVVTVNFPHADMSHAIMSPGDFDDWHDPLVEYYPWRLAWATNRDHPLPIIVHDGLAPVLVGSIVDEFSDIPLNGAGFPDIGFQLRSSGGQPVDVTPAWVGEGRNWRWDIYLADNSGAVLPDGIHTLRISNVRDRTGNPNPGLTKHFAFRTDSHAPALDLDPQPPRYRVLGAADGFDGAPALTIGGYARDPNLRNVRIRFIRHDGNAVRTVVRTVFIDGYNIRYDSDNIRDNDYGPLDGSVTRGAGTAEWEWDPVGRTWVLRWTYALSHADYDYYFDAGDGNLTSGAYEIEVVALDWRRSGGASEPETWAFTKDTTPPEIRFFASDDIANAPAGGPAASTVAPGSPARRFGSDTDVIRGTARDQHSDVAMVQFRIERYDWPGWAPVQDWTNAGGIPSRSRNWETPALGVPVADGGLGLAEGLYRIRVRAMDSSWFADAGVDWFETGADGNFVMDNWFDTDADGGFRPDVAGNPVGSNWYYFYFDRGPPVLDFVDPPVQTMSSRFGTGTGTPDTLGFRISAGDPNRLARITARIYAQGTDTPIREVDMPNIRQPSLVDHLLSIPVSVTANGPHTVVITATDLAVAPGDPPAGRSLTIRRNFNLDNTPPSGMFSSPLEMLGGHDVVISGEALDAGSGPARAWVRFGLFGTVPPGGLNEAGLDSMRDALWGHYTGGSVAADTAHNDGYFEASASSWFRFDSPVNLDPPPSGWPDGLNVTRNSLFSWEIRAGFDAVLALAQSTGMSHVAAGGVLEMPVWFRVVDNAGNAGYHRHVIRVNQEAARPVNTVVTPSGDGDIGLPRGGAVTFGGVAQIHAPGVNVAQVLYRVWIGRPDDSVTGGVLPGYSLRVATATELGLQPPTMLPGVQDRLDEHNLWDSGEQHWFPAPLDSPGTGLTPWSFRLNAGGELTALMADYGFLHGDDVGDNDMLFVMVETVAVNSETGAVFDPATHRRMSAGDGEVDFENPEPNRRTFYLSVTAPAIFATRPEQLAGTNPGSVSVQGVNSGFYPARGASPANPHSGVVTITAYLDAAYGRTISMVRIVRPDEGPGLNQVVYGSGAVTLPGLTITPVAGTDGRVAHLVYALDTRGTNIVGRGGGLYRVEIRVSNDLDPPSETTLTLPIVIDNVAPVSDPAPTFRTPGTRAGRWEYFQGRALDGSLALGTTPVAIDRFTHAGAGISRVYAWFESGIHGRQFVAHDGSATRLYNAAETTTFPNLWIDRNATVNGAYVSFANAAAAGEPSAAGVRIPTALPSGAGNVWIMRIDGDTPGLPAGRDRGHQWIESQDGRIVQWMFSVNTTYLPDGPLTLRYIVVDEAGNATLNQQSVVIRNRIPEITGVTLNTVDAGGNSVGGLTLASLGLAPRAEGYVDTGWTVRNRELGLTVNTILGNAPLNFRLQHVTRERTRLTREMLGTLVARRDNPAFINLFTVDAVGLGGTFAIWNMLGYTGDEIPVRGSHFVLANLTQDQINMVPDPANSDDSIWVWVYTQGAAPVNSGPVGWRIPNDPRAGVGTPTLIFPRTGGTGDTGAFVATAAEVGNRIPHFVLARNPAGVPVPGTAAGQAGDPNRPFFLLRAWDSVTAANPPTAAAGVGGWTPTPPRIENEQLHTAAVLAMDVFLFDITPPGAVLHDLNPFFERGVTGNNLTPAGRNATIRNALAPDPNDDGVGENNVNRDRGGLFNAGTGANPARSGHIEPRADSPVFTARPATWGSDPATAAGQGSLDRDLVSGRIILRGRATDNERVQRIELAITQDVAGLTTVPAAGAWFTILEWDGTAREMTPRAGSPTTNPTMRPTAGPVTGMGAGTHVFDARAEERLQDGRHLVEWSFMWDTETFLNAGPAANVRISVRVTDASNNYYEDYFHVNIVPYVTGFERQARYQTIRSMQGWYSFYQGEIGIAALGFNLGGGIIATGIPLTNPMREDSDSPLGGSYRINFAIPANAQSGRIDFSIVPATMAGGTDPVPIRNHASNHAQFWNMENLFGTRSNLWINRPYAHIWRSSHQTAAPATFMGPLANSVGLDHPGMALQHTLAGGAGNRNRVGMLHGAWSVFGNVMVHYGTNEGGTVSGATDAYSTRLTTATPADPFLQPDISLHNGTGVPNIAFIHQADGLATVRLRTLVHRQSTGVDAAVAGAAVNNAANRELRLNLFPNLVGSADAPTQRWQNVRTVKAAANLHAPSAAEGGGLGSIADSLAAASDPGRLFTTVYDSFRRELVFITQGSARTVGETGTANATTAMSIDGTAPAGVTVGGQTQITASGAGRATNAGQFSAVGFDATGPIIAYSADDTIRVAFGTNFATVAGTGWSRVEILAAGHALRNGSGGYVSMAIDAGGGIHLAFFNSVHGALVYAHSAGRGQSFTAHVVDTAPGVGTWTDISIDGHGNPWIVYGYQSRQGQFDGVRVAYRSASAAGTGSGTRFSRPVNCRVTGVRVPGYWEALQMAAPFSVIYDRLNIEAWPPNANSGATMDAEFVTAATGNRPWSAAIGFRGAGSGCALGGGDTNERFRIGYFFWPDPTAATIGTTWPPAP